MSDDDTIQYRYQPERSDWEAWKQHVPRSLSLHTRLDHLRRIDQDFDLRQLVAAHMAADDDATPDEQPVGEIDDDNARLLLTQIRIRCMSGLPSARTNGCDTAADKLNEIKQLTEKLLDD